MAVAIAGASASRALHLGAAALRGAGVVALTLACTACPGPPPGEGEKALAGFRRAEPVIAALEQYRQARGAYPDSLGTLVPRFLPRGALAIPTSASLRYPLQYERAADGYRLGFRYTGPGMNQCWYRSAAARWQCSGHW